MSPFTFFFLFLFEKKKTQKKSKRLGANYLEPVPWIFRGRNLTTKTLPPTPPHPTIIRKRGEGGGGGGRGGLFYIVEHWAEITKRQHHFRPSLCFVLIKQSDSSCQYQFTSWLLIAKGKKDSKLPQAQSPKAPKPTETSAPPVHLQGGSAWSSQPAALSVLTPSRVASRKQPTPLPPHQHTDPLTQPSEPLLIPKLRN